jgi:hypothetical protein
MTSEIAEVHTDISHAQHCIHIVTRMTAVMLATVVTVPVAEVFINASFNYVLNSS